MSDTKIITLAIDGDILVYRAALAAQQEGFNIVLEDGTTIGCTSMMSVKRRLKELQLEAEKVTIVESVVLKNNHPKLIKDSINFYVSTIIKNVSTEVKKIYKKPFKIYVKMCVGGPTNFRKDIPLFRKYKDRKDERPLALKEAAQIIQEIFECDVSVGIEADDRVSMFGYSGHKDMSVIAVTEDKDAKQTPMWLFIPRKKQLLNCEGFGYIELVTKTSVNKNTGVTKKTYKIEGKGRFFLYYQIVCGDVVDTYNPFTPRITELKFYNLFKDFKTDKECWSKIFQLFVDRYGHLEEYEDWTGEKHKGGAIEILQNYVDIAHMQRWDNDRLEVRKLLTKYELI